MNRILIVEDDADIRFMVTFALRAAGYEVTDVECAEDAVDHLDLHDLALLDIRLPGMSGLDLLRLHVAQGGHMPVIVMSAHAGLDVGAEAMSAGAVQMLTKPFEVGELIAAVEGQLQSPRPLSS